MIWFVAGINGAGKSTFASSPLVTRALGVDAVRNPDLMAAYLATEIGIDYALANLAAAVITQGEVFRVAVAPEPRSIAIETVMSSGKYDPILDIAEQRGIEIGLVYIGLRSVELALKRVETRVSAGFHSVPEDQVRQRWPKSLASLGRWAPRVDKLFVFSNNHADRDPILVAWKAGKTEEIAILDRRELPEVVAALNH